MQLFFNQFFEIRLAEEVFHYVQTLINRQYIFQWKHQPTFQQAGSHRTNRFINHVQQAAASIVHAAYQLKAANGEFIQTDVLIFFNTCQRSDMSDLGMLRHDKILQDSSRSDDTILEMLYTKTFQVLCFKMLQKFLTGGGLCKYPIVQFESKELTSEVTLKHATFSTFKKHFFRSEVIQEFIYIVERSLCSEEFTRRYIEKCHTTRSLTKMYGSQKIILPVIQYIIIDGNTGSYQFRNAPFHQFLGHLRVFQLVTDGHTLPGTYQLR